MSPSAGKPAVPLPHETLLVPLLDVAADVLRELEPAEIPAALRPLAGFDRRGLTRSAARAQLARAVETEKAFRAKVVERFTQRPEVQAVLEAWSPNEASKLVTDSAGREDLPLLVSALFAAKPAGWEFGLGVASEAFERRRRDDDAEDDRRAVETRIATAERARKRAEEARAAMEVQANRMELELKEERRLRRARDEEVVAERQEDVQRIEALESALAQARTSIEKEEGRRAAAEEQATRARRDAEEAAASAGRLEAELRTAATASVRAAEQLTAAEAKVTELAARVDALEAQLARERSGRPVAEGASDGVGDSAATVPAAVPGLAQADLRVLDQVARVAAEMARQLDGLAQRAAAPPPPATTAAKPVAPPPAPAVPHPVAAPATQPPLAAPASPAPPAPAPLAAPEPEAIAAPPATSTQPSEPAPVAEPELPAPPASTAPASPVVDVTNDDDTSDDRGDDEPLDAIPVQVPTTTRRGRRRAQVPVPPGMLDDSVEAADAMVRTPGLAIVVDGYNVSMQAWPTASLQQQRDRLCSALNELQLRVRCQVTVIFDGADVEGTRPVRYPGLRVIFSDPGEEADDVVVRQVAARPLDVPVLVASSDAWVREHAEAEGARVIASPTLLKVLRR